MELLDFVTKLARSQSTNDSERYWRLIVNCFLVDRLEQLELASLPTKFEQYYGRIHSLNGKLSALLEESEFKEICITEIQNSTLLIRPTELILKVLRLNTQDPKELLIPSTVLNNNHNVIHPTNPFAMDALKELEKNGETESETRFGRLTLEELNCGICFDLLKEAVEADCCKNIFCLPCIEQNNRKCPNCRILVEWSVNEPIRRLVGKKPIKCNYENCCAWSTVSEIEQHRFGCEFNPVNLLVNCQKCQQQIMRRLLEEHLSDTCEMVEVPCRLCGLMFTRKDIDNHETQQCEFRRVTCNNGCAVEMTYKEYFTSHLSNCPCQLIKCTNEECKVEVQRQNLQKHLQSCAYSEVPCVNSMRGCPVLVLRSNRVTAMRMHLDECDFKIVSCNGCQRGMLRRELKSHPCDRMVIKCQFCGGAFKRMHSNTHVEKCGAVPISCPNCCGETFQRSMKNSHLQKCPMRLVPCQQCGKSIVFNAIESHRTNACIHVTCDKCQEVVLASFKSWHDSDTCPERTVECEKCALPMPFKNMDSHQC